MNITSHAPDVDSRALDVGSHTTDIDSHTPDVNSRIMDNDSHTPDVSFRTLDIDSRALDVGSRITDVSFLTLDVNSHVLAIISLATGSHLLPAGNFLWNPETTKRLRVPASGFKQANEVFIKGNVGESGLSHYRGTTAAIFNGIKIKCFPEYQKKFPTHPPFPPYLPVTKSYLPASFPQKPTSQYDQTVNITLSFSITVCFLHRKLLLQADLPKLKNSRAGNTGRKRPHSS